jgi:heme/copper-type cytochrome/quinol oxidase subunit 2
MTIARPLRIAAVALTLLAGTAFAEDTFTIAFKDHRIVPAELVVPAGKKIKLIVDNQDATPEEFESHALNREKVIPGKSKGTLYIGPLKPGAYDIFGDFNQATAQGRIIAQ